MMRDGFSAPDRFCTCGSGRAAVRKNAVRPSRIRPALTSREKEVLLAWLRHDTRDDAARDLYITVNTVRKHLERIREKYAEVGRRASTKTELFVRAVQDGLIDVDAS